MQKYIQLGIYDEGEVIITRDPDETFLDATVDFALIREVRGNGRPGPFGMTYYDPRYVDFDVMYIGRPATWQAVLENGLDALKDKKDNALRFVLESPYCIEPAVFDLLYGAYPDTPLRDMLYKCKRLDAAKWLLEHCPASRRYRGLAYPMKEVLAYARERESAEIFEYVYGCTQEEYRKVLERKRA